MRNLFPFRLVSSSVRSFVRPSIALGLSPAWHLLSGKYVSLTWSCGRPTRSSKANQSARLLFPVDGFHSRVLRTWRMPVALDSTSGTFHGSLRETCLPNKTIVSQKSSFYWRRFFENRQSANLSFFLISSNILQRDVWRELKTKLAKSSRVEGLLRLYYIKFWSWARSSKRKKDFHLHLLRAARETKTLFDSMSSISIIFCHLPVNFRVVDFFDER